MARLHLVRHGQAEAGWDVDPDPGLSDLGARQAELVAGRLAGLLTPRPIVVSPLRRTRETAAPLERRWGVSALVDPTVGEIPSPVTAVEERGAWLDHALHARYPELEPMVHDWRRALLDRVLAMTEDTVIVTHFVAINAVVGAAEGVDDVTSFLPANTSVTEVEVLDGALAVVSRGAEAPPVVG